MPLFWKICWCVVILCIPVLGCKNHNSTLNSSYKYNNIADSKWMLNHKGNNYSLSLSHGEDIWFDGQLIVNHLDTFVLDGFVKGNTYPTGYFLKSDTTIIGRSMLVYFQDSVKFDDWDNKIFDSEVFFYRMK